MRGQLVDGACERISVRFTAGALAEIDAARGDTPRAVWLRELAMREAMADG